MLFITMHSANCFTYTIKYTPHNNLKGSQASPFSTPSAI